MRRAGYCLISSALGLVLGNQGFGHEAVDAAVMVNATLTNNPPGILLDWETSDQATGYRIYRKTITGNLWGNPRAVLPAQAAGFADSNVRIGRAYEYRVERIANNYEGNGYVCAGIELPLQESHGTVILLVEDDLVAPLVAEITRLEDDLIGDGWRIIRRQVSRKTAPVSVKALIKKACAAAPKPPRALFLLGRIPVPYSGDFAPDGHSDHQGAWPADVFYADVDGVWTDSRVQSTGAASPRQRNVPGDGKFDQSHLPANARLMVGRVDMAKLTHFDMPEAELVRRYLDKDHAFRHGQISVEQRALIDDEFGWHDQGAAYAASGWRSFAPLVGRNNVSAGVFRPTLQEQSYLWAYGCGAGGYTGIGDVLSASDFINKPFLAVFCFLFGSYMGDWDSSADQPGLMRSALAAKGNTLAVGWSGQPHWFMHHMGIGFPIGFSVRLTQNNGGNFYRGPGGKGWGVPDRGVHIALLGDPTLRLHPVPPPSGVTAQPEGNTVRVSWNASAAQNLVGYHLYRADQRLGNFTRLTAAPVTETSYVDRAPNGGAIYQIRAVLLQRSPTATYFNQSQGIFVSAGGS